MRRVSSSNYNSIRHVRTIVNEIINVKARERLHLTLALCVRFICLFKESYFSLLLHNHHHQPSTALEVGKMFVEITTPVTDKRNEEKERRNKKNLIHMEH